MKLKLLLSLSLFTLFISSWSVVASDVPGKSTTCIFKPIQPNPGTAIVMSGAVIQPKTGISILTGGAVYVCADLAHNLVASITGARLTNSVVDEIVSVAVPTLAMLAFANAKLNDKTQVALDLAVAGLLATGNILRKKIMSHRK